MAFTEVISKSFVIEEPSDLHMTFSCAINLTAAMTITANTIIQEGAASATKTFTPSYIQSANFTFSFCDFFEAVSACSAVVTVKLNASTGTFTINTAQVSLNILKFPLPVTASDTGTITYLVQIASASRTLLDQRIKSFDIDTATGTLYAGFKWVENEDRWDICKTTTSNITSWTSTVMPTTTSMYTSGNTGIHDLSMDFNGGNLHVAHYAHISSSGTMGMICSYNYYDGTNWGYPAHSKIISAINTSLATNDNDMQTQVIASSTNLIHYISPLLYLTKKCGYYTSNDYFATRSSTTYPFENNGKYIKSLLDINDDTIVHSIFDNVSDFDLKYVKYEGTAWGTSETILTDYITTIEQQKNKAICQSSQGTLFVAQLVNWTSTYTSLFLFKKTAGATSWGTAWQSFARSAMNSIAMCFDAQTPPNPIITYSVASAQICCKKFDINLSAWESEGTIPVLDSGDLYANNPQVKYYNGLHVVFESGVTASETKIAYYYNSDY